MAATTHSLTPTGSSTSTSSSADVLGDKKVSAEKYAVFYSGADTQGWDSVSGSGDADYARTLAESLNQISTGIACYLHHLHSEKDVYAFIASHKSSETPILHVLRNAPRIGSAFTKEGLQAFKKAGGKVVVTAVEFHKHRNSREGVQNIQDLLNCMKFADSLVFLDELDKKSAEESLSTFAAGDLELKTKIAQSKVICVPPTVTPTLPVGATRGNDIISFGMIRTGKGLAHIRKLAGLIKQSSDPRIKDRKMIVVGTVMLNPVSTGATTLTGTPTTAPTTERQNLSRNHELYRLMYCLYPNKREEMLAKIKGDTSDNKTLKLLLKSYQEEERSGTLKSALPIELYVDMPLTELPALFRRAKYSFLPAYRGATLRNTSMSCSLAQAETGLITISHRDSFTPAEFEKKAKYEKAMVLFENDDFGHGSDDTLKYENDGYAGAVLTEILAREANPKLNEETLEVAKQLMRERLSRKVIALQHKEAYEALLKQPLAAIGTIGEMGATAATSVETLPPVKKPSTSPAPVALKSESTVTPTTTAEPVLLGPVIMMPSKADKKAVFDVPEGETTSSRELKRKLEKSKAKKTEKLFQVFMTAASKSSFDEMAGTGDMDYLRAVIKGVNEELPIEAVPIQGMHDEKTIFDFIASKQKTARPILHLHLNFPGTGSAFSLEGLKLFKRRGGKLIISAIEFAKYPAKSGYKETMLHYLALADSIIFLDEVDKKEALSLLACESGDDLKISRELQVLQKDKRLEKILTAAQIIPLMPTIPTSLKSTSSFDGSILTFGMIREGKGLAHVIKLAKLIKKSKDKPHLNRKKVFVVGSVQEHPDSTNAELFKLMSALYPDKTTEMLGKNIKELKELLSVYQTQEKAGKLQAAIPLELHLDVPPEKLEPLFESCSHAFLPAYRGGTLRNSSIVNVLANNLVIYTHKTAFTPDCLLPGGEHHGAMVLMDSDDYGTETNGEPDNNGYAYEVLQDFYKRCQDYKLDTETRKRAAKLQDSYFSSDTLFAHFATAYRAALYQDQPEYLAFMAWQATYYAKRSYAKFQKVQGVDIKKQSQLNLKNLIQRLKTMSGSYFSPETKKFFLEKLRGRVLTPGEEEVVDTLLQMPWFIKHVTEHYKIIRQQGGNRLLSLDQRRRLGEKIQNANTNAAEGNTDNVFLSMNPGKDFETVRFLDRVNTEISAEAERLEKTAAFALQGIWSSGHMYAFITEQDGEPVNIFGTLYQVRYRKNMSVTTGEEEWVKECVYTLPDGQQVIQSVYKQDEIFVHPKIQFALALMTIEKIRIMGKVAWEKIMRADPKTLQDLVQMLFHSGVFEVHKPAQFLLDTPGVSVTKRKPKAHHSDTADVEIMQPLIEAALLGDEERVMKSLSEDLPLETTVYMNGYQFNLLAAAILGGHRKLVAELLDRGVDLHRDVYMPKGKDSKGSVHMLSMNLLGFVAILAKSDLCLAVLKEIMGDKLKSEPKIQHEMALTIAELLIKQGSKFKRQADITRPIILSDDDFLNILYYFRPPLALIHLLLQAYQGKGEDLPLVEAVYLQLPELVELLLKQGAEVNETSNKDAEGNLKQNRFSQKEPLPECTPLIAAIQLKDLTMTELLIRYGANVNQPYTAGEIGNSINIEVMLIRVSEYEDYSPLMMAVQLGQIEICRALLKAGALVTHRSIQGHTAFSIARAASREDILTLLRAYLKPQPSYPLHEAAAKSDWETCRVLMRHPGVDQCLNSEGQSAYDMNPLLLKQAFIPAERQREQYKAHMTQVRMIMVFRDVNKERHYLINKNPDEDESMSIILPFISCVPRDTTPRNILKLSSMMNIARSEKDFILREHGTFSTGIEEEGIFYIEHIRTIEYGPEALEKILASQNKEDFTFIPESALKEYALKKSKESLEMHYAGGALSKTTTRLLVCLASQTADVVFSPKERSELIAVYREERLLIHRLFALAKQGDFAVIKKLMQNTSLSINSPIPVSADLSYGYPSGRLKKYYGKHDYALRAAIYAGHFECALKMIDQLDAQFGNFISPDEILERIINERIIKAGQLDFLKCCIQKLQEEGQNVKPILEGHYHAILKYSKVEILNYLLENDLLSYSPEDIIATAAYSYLSVDVVRAFVSKIKNPKKLAYTFTSVIDHYGKDGIFELIKDGVPVLNEKSTYNHLTQEEIHRNVVEIFKLLSPYFGSMDIPLWIKIAINKKNGALIDMVQTIKTPSSPGINEIYERRAFDTIDKTLKENEEITFALLSRLIDPKADWSPIVPAIHRLIKSKVMEEKILFEKIELMYQKTAPQLLELRLAVQTGDVKKLSELIKQGIDVDVQLFLAIPSAVPSIATVPAPAPATIPASTTIAPTTATPVAVASTFVSQFSTPLQIALKNKQYDCVKFLVENGVDFSNMTSEDLDEMRKANLKELLSLLAKKLSEVLTDSMDEIERARLTYLMFQLTKSCEALAIPVPLKPRPTTLTVSYDKKREEGSSSSTSTSSSSGISVGSETEKAKKSSLYDL